MAETELDVTSVDFSSKDKIKGIVLPNKLTAELAYDVGVHIADGCMNAYKVRTGTDFYYKCSGNPETEKEWYDAVLLPLKKKLFNFPNEAKLMKDGTYGLNFRSKAIVQFYCKVIGLPLGKKSQTIVIPKIIFDNPDLRLPCLRGIFDADGYVSFKKRYKKFHYYPYLGFSTQSKVLVHQIKAILDNLEIPNSACCVERFDKRFKENKPIHAALVSGKIAFKKFEEIVGFRVTNDIAKIRIWEKFGYCPPNISFSEKTEILRGKKNPLEYYGPGEI